MIGSMECRRVSRLLWDHALNRLGERDAVLVNRHLESCARCAAQMEAVRRTTCAVHAYAEAPLPAASGDWLALRAQLEKQASTSPRRASGRAPRWALAGALAAAALAVVALPQLRHVIPTGGPAHPVVAAVTPAVRQEMRGRTDNHPVRPTVERRGKQEQEGVRPTIRPAATRQAPEPRRRAPRYRTLWARRDQPTKVASLKYAGAAGAAKPAGRGTGLQAGPPRPTLVMGSAVPPAGPTVARTFVMGAIPTSYGSARLASTNDSGASENETW